MNLKFNIDRPKASDEEIKKHQNFKELVERFKQQSLKQAQGDESWWKNKKVRYATVIAGITVVCTVTYLSILNSQKQKTKKNETVITQKTQHTNTGPDKFIHEPSSKLKIAYSSYKINNGKGGDITHNSSSKIKIPKNSFVDKNGKDIVGDVTIEYREFHDAADIIAGGVPMAYDSAGKKYNLETAGMFDIKGSQNGEPVFIKPDKTLKVELASANNEQRFNQYYLDTISQNWTYIKKDRAEAIIAKTENRSVTDIKRPPTTAKIEQLKQEVEVVIPKKIDSVKVVYENKVQKLPKAVEPFKPAKLNSSRPSFKLEGSYDEFPELAAFENVTFEVGTENKNYNKEFNEITWSDLKISKGPVKGKNYLLTLSYRNRTEKLIVYPVLSGKDLAKAEKIYEKNLEEFEALSEKRQAEEKRLISEMETKRAAYFAEQKRKKEEYESERAKLFAKFNVQEQNELASNFNSMRIDVKATRIFAVNRFGIYNSDCPRNVPNGASISPVFVLHENEKPVYPDNVYLVDHVAKTVYGLSRDNGFQLNYDLNNEYSICVFYKNKLFLCNKASFKEATESGKNKFTVTALPEKADNLVDLKNMLEI
jgi:hypothetical protein